MAYLSIRKRYKDRDVLNFYAIENTWNKSNGCQDKTQTYLGGKSLGKYNFNNNALRFEDLFRGTEHERAYWNWRQLTEAQEDQSNLTTIEKIQDCDVRFSGVGLLLGHIAKGINLEQYLEQVFGSVMTQKILSLTFYCASNDGAPLYQASRWSRDQVLPYQDAFSEGDIASVLQDISPSEILSFQKLWIKQTDPSDRLSLDITSVSSYSKNNVDVGYGYNRDHGNLPQINVLLIVSQTTRLPVWFQQLSGPISDITTIKDTAKILKQIEMTPCNLVMDRGFASEQNIKCLLKERIKFTLGIPLCRFKAYREAVREAYDQNEFCNPHNTLDLFEDEDKVQTQAVTKLLKIDNHRAYLHMYFTDFYKTQHNTVLMERLKEVERRLKNNEAIKNPVDQELADKCFEVKVTPKKGRQVKVLKDQIARLRDNDAGFFVIMSTQFKDPNEALWAYKLRDGVEKRFDDIKNESDFNRLRMHSERTEQARLFIQFLAEILRCRVQYVMQMNKDLPKTIKTACILIKEAASIKRIHISGHNPFYLRPTKHVHTILKIFGIDVNTKS